MIETLQQPKTINVFVNDWFLFLELVNKFPQNENLFGISRLKLFFGREWFMSCDRQVELGEEYKGEEFDYMFFNAESLKIYHINYHHFALDLNNVGAKQDAKFIIFSCDACSECNLFVKEIYKNLQLDLIKQNGIEDYPAIIKKYFNDFLS